MIDDPISRIEAALAHPALHDEGASLADTWYAVYAVHAACSPDRIERVLTELERLRAEQDGHIYRLREQIGRDTAQIERMRAALACALADAINEAREMGLGEQA